MRLSHKLINLYEYKIAVNAAISPDLSNHFDLFLSEVILKYIQMEKIVE